MQHIDNMPKRKRALVFFLVIGILMPIANINSYAANTNENKKKLEEINKKIKANKSALNQVNGKKFNLLSEMKTLDTQMSKIQTSIINLNKKINFTNNKIIKVSKQLKIAKKKAKIQKNKLYNRIETMYEMGNQSTLEVLLESKTISDFFMRIEILKDMAEYDNDILKKFKKTQKDIQVKKNILVIEKKNLEKYKATQVSKKFGLAKSIEDRKKLVQVLNKKKDVYEDALDDLMKSSMEIEKQLQEVAKDSKVVYTGGVFSWPVPSCHLVTSPFGYRIHPITGTRKLHTGIDIGAGYGAPIYATHSGTVVMAGWYGGYGQAVIIDHGGGISSLYGHCSSLAVSPGQKIEQGQIIAYVGSTGFSTGAHLHFEIRLGGSPVNPMNYVK